MLLQHPAANQCPALAGYLTCEKITVVDKVADGSAPGRRAVGPLDTRTCFNHKMGQCLRH